MSLSGSREPHSFLFFLDQFLCFSAYEADNQTTRVFLSMSEKSVGGIELEQIEANVPKNYRESKSAKGGNISVLHSKVYSTLNFNNVVVIIKKRI